MRILYVTQTFPPEPGATQRPLKQAVCLKDLGCDVTILTTMPYYPLGRVYDGYRGKCLVKENIEGVKIIRIWSVPAPNRGKWLRFISWASFAIGASIVGIFLQRHELVVASVPNLGTEIAGVLVARFKRSKLLLELRDVFPDNLTLCGISMTSLSARLLLVYFKLVYHLIDLVAVPGENMRIVLIERGVAPKRILLLPHAADPDQLDRGNGQPIRQEFHLENKFVVLYAGSFSCYYDIPNLVEAAILLRERLPCFHLMLVGTGPDWQAVECMIKQNGLKNVAMVGPVAPADVGDYLRAADLFIYSLGGTFPSIIQDLLTTKPCEYLMVGKPVIAVDNGVVCGNFLESIGAGLGVPVHQPEALAEAIISFARNPHEVARCGNNARQYARAYLERKKIMKVFYAELVQKLAMPA